MTAGLDDALNRRPLRLLDICLSLFAIALCVGLCLRGAAAARDKALLSEMFYYSATLRLNAAEDYALTGSFHKTDALIADRKPDALDARFDYRLNDGVVAASGMLQHPDRQVRLDFHAAVVPDAPSYTVLWLCGGHTPPSGWIEPSPEDHSTLAPELMPALCRNPGLR